MKNYQEDVYQSNRPTFLFAENGMPLSSISAPGLDAVWVGESRYGTQLLLLRLGDQLMEINYDGPADVSDHLDVYVELLNTYQ